MMEGRIIEMDREREEDYRGGLERWRWMEGTIGRGGGALIAGVWFSSRWFLSGEGGGRSQAVGGVGVVLPGLIKLRPLLHPSSA